MKLSKVQPRTTESGAKMEEKGRCKAGAKANQGQQRAAKSMMKAIRVAILGRQS